MGVLSIFTWETDGEVELVGEGYNAAVVPAGTDLRVKELMSEFEVVWSSSFGAHRCNAIFADYLGTEFEALELGFGDEKAAAAARHADGRRFAIVDDEQRQLQGVPEGCLAVWVDKGGLDGTHVEKLMEWARG